MSEQLDLRLILSRALKTDQLSLEHDTVIVSPELTKLIAEAVCANCQPKPAAAKSATS